MSDHDDRYCPLKLCRHGALRSHFHRSECAPQLVQVVRLSVACVDMPAPLHPSGVRPQIDRAERARVRSAQIRLASARPLSMRNGWLSDKPRAWEAAKTFLPCGRVRTRTTTVCRSCGLCLCPRHSGGAPHERAAAALQSGSSTRCAVTPAKNVRPLPQRPWRSPKRSPSPLRSRASIPPGTRGIPRQPLPPPTTPDWIRRRESDPQKDPTDRLSASRPPEGNLV